HLVDHLAGNIYLAGVLISHVAFLIALIFLYLLARDEFDHPTAARTVLYLAAAPAAVFFSAVYTESLFLLLVVITFYCARHRQWVAAALAGGIAAATRNTGVVLAAVVALEGLHQQGVRWRPRAWHPAIWGRHLRAQLPLFLAAWPSLLAAACVPTGL